MPSLRPSAAERSDRSNILEFQHRERFRGPALLQIEIVFSDLRVGKFAQHFGFGAGTDRLGDDQKGVLLVACDHQNRHGPRFASVRSPRRHLHTVGLVHCLPFLISIAAVAAALPGADSRSSGEGARDHHNQRVDIDPPMDVDKAVLREADLRCGIRRLRLTLKFSQDGVPDRGLQVHD
ncbi:protein of unknown function [Methylorubrum extorquens DM4]|uniref:Uncharacterized protein n=1 Tax=Methylorubrum extorquens (strain DSM 6343 / CIP 106787 / DM4) TaxID=661410 RepID=C7CJS0_METED|nr:protein of unknown function [Methylorubrum extorquens DM4]